MTTLDNDNELHLLETARQRLASAADLNRDSDRQNAYGWSLLAMAIAEAQQDLQRALLVARQRSGYVGGVPSAQAALRYYAAGN